MFQFPMEPAPGQKPPAPGAAKPAAGPLTLVCDPLSMPMRMPPTIPERMPAKSGAPDASAMPRQSGSATRNTATPAVRSRARVDGEKSCVRSKMVRSIGLKGYGGAPLP